MAKDHDTEIEATIFHNDVRVFGKDFERFYQRAESLPGVRFVRSYVLIGKELPESKNVTIKYSADGGGVKEEEFDLVDVPSVVQYASTLSNVAHVQENLFSCSTDAARQI